MAGAITRTLAAMSYVLEPSEGPRPAGDGRSLVMLNYGLLFVSIFFAGVPALIAVALAYSQRPKAPPLLRTHYSYQIGLFWTAFFIALLAGSLGFSGLVLAVIELLSAGAESAVSGFRIWKLNVHGEIMVLMVAGALLAAADAVLLMVCSGFGFIRLASNRSLRKSAA